MMHSLTNTTTSRRKTANQLRKQKKLSTMSLLSSPGKFRLPVRGILFGVLIGLLVQEGTSEGNDTGSNDKVVVVSKDPRINPNSGPSNPAGVPNLARVTTVGGFPALPSIGEKPAARTGSRRTESPSPSAKLTDAKSGANDAADSRDDEKVSEPSTPTPSGKTAEPVNAKSSAAAAGGVPAAVPEAHLPARPASNHGEFKVSQLYQEDQFTNRFTSQAQDLAKSLEARQAELNKLQAGETDFASADIRAKEGQSSFCQAWDEEVIALKKFVEAKEKTRSKYIEKAVAQKREEHQREVNAATADVKATQEKQSMLEGLREQTDAHHKSRAELAQSIRGELERYIKHDAARAQVDLKNAADHAAEAANAVDTKHDNLHSALQERHIELSDKHAGFKDEIREQVAEIETKFEKNESDKEQRHEVTLEKANEFTTLAKEELNHRANTLEGKNKALRTDHANLHNVVGSHANNLETTRKYILDRFGGKESWDGKCVDTFGKWIKPDGVNAASPVASDVESQGGSSPSAMSEGSTNASDRAVVSGRRRLAADPAPLTASERSLARRRLMNRPKAHTAVLEALYLEEINGLN